MSFNKSEICWIGSYIDSLAWMKNKATVNPINDDDRCFQYAATVALNHEGTGKHPQRISKIKLSLTNKTEKE